MKYLYLILLALATCSLKMGGWNEIKDFEQSNDVRINEAIQKATDDFLIRINSMNRDAFDIRPIGVYTQLVAGTNYKVILATNTFIPGRHDLAIHEYTYTLDPVWANSNGERNWNDEYNRYNDPIFDETISLNSAIYSRIHSAVSKSLMNTKYKLSFVSSIKSCNVNGVTFYGVYAQTNGKNNESSFVVVQNDDGTFAVLSQFN